MLFFVFFLKNCKNRPVPPAAGAPLPDPSQPLPFCFEIPVAWYRDIASRKFFRGQGQIIEGQNFFVYSEENDGIKCLNRYYTGILRAVCTNVNPHLIADQRNFKAKYLQNGEEN